VNSSATRRTADSPRVGRVILTRMDASTLLLILVVVTALSFDVTNGFHDTANAMATSIATGALPPRVAVGLSAVLNIVGAFLSLKVAATVASGIVDSGKVTLTVVFAGLVGAIFWNLLTWYLGLPSSSSHALIGGIVGATWIAAGVEAVRWTGVVSKVLVPAIAAPVLAAAVATIGTYTALKLTKGIPEGHRGRGFRIGQIGSASLVSLAHGTNDAQKTMGVITLALIADKTIGKNAGVPAWVVVSCALAIGLGTYSGGWRVMRTLGKGLTEIHPPQGFAAEAASAAVILAGSHAGFPLSTTHVVSGSVVGSGIGTRLANVRWSLAGRIAVAWAFTLPMAALVGAVAFWIANRLGGATGVLIVFALAVLMAALFFRASRRTLVDAHNVNDAWDDGAVTPVPATVGASV
jgi:inorganic phosphate transporter, PiT family